MVFFNSNVRKKYHAHDAISFKIDEGAYSGISGKDRIQFIVIGFVPWRTTLSSQVHKVLNQVVSEKLAGHKCLEVIVYGLHDEIETGWHPVRGSISNWRISKLRADVVASALEKEGINKDIIQRIDKKNIDPLSTARTKDIVHFEKHGDALSIWRDRINDCAVLVEIGFEEKSTREV